MQLVRSTTYMTLRTTKVTKLSKVYKGKLLIWCWHLMCIYIYIFDQWLAASGSDCGNCIFITIGWFYHKHDMSNCRRNNINRSIERHFITWHFIIGLAAKKCRNCIFISMQAILPETWHEGLQKNTIKQSIEKGKPITHSKEEHWTHKHKEARMEGRNLRHEHEGLVQISLL